MGMPAVILLVIAIIVALFIVSAIAAMRSYAPWVPSSASLAKKALEHINPDPKTTFIDIGCGDGRIVRLAAKRGLIAYGVENSLFPFLLAKIRLFFSKEKYSIEFKNLFALNLSHYKIIYMYGLPKAIHEKLEPRFEKELQPDSYLISYNFSLKSKNPIFELHDKWRNVFIYRY